MKTILIVEDDDSIADALELILGMEGYETVHANNGKEALILLVDMTPDLILCDIQMPIMNGVALLRALQSSKFKTIPLVMMSADSRSLIPEQTHFIAKPFDVDTVLDVIERLIPSIDVDL